MWRGEMEYKKQTWLVSVDTSFSLPGPKMTDTSITFQPRLIDWVDLYKLKNTGHIPFLIDCK